MALLPPDSPRRRDRGKEEAARKQRARFARDVGDEHGLAWAHQPPPPQAQQVHHHRRVDLHPVRGARRAAAGPARRRQPADPGQLQHPGAWPPDRRRSGPGDQLRLAGRRPAAGAVRAGHGRGRGDRPGRRPGHTGQRPGAVRADHADRTAAPQQTLARGPDNTGAHEVALFRHTGTAWASGSRVAYWKCPSRSRSGCRSCVNASRDARVTALPKSPVKERSCPHARGRRGSSVSPSVRRRFPAWSW